MSTTKPSICRLCLAHCGILATAENGRLVKVTGDPDNPLFKGYTCPKGRALPEYHNHPERLLHSVKRQPDGGFQAIASEAAMDEVADRLRAIIARHGPRAVAIYMGTNSLPYPAGTACSFALLNAIGSPMFFTSNTIDQPNKQIAQALHGIWQGGDQDFDTADSWVLIGVNPVISKAAGIPCQNPAQKLKDAVNRGMQLVVIDPRKSETARRATVHLQPRPGEDPTILAGMIHVVLQEQLYDQAFVAEHAEGLEALRTQVAPYTPDYVAGRAGIEAAQLVRAARIFAGARRGAVNTGTGASFSMNSNLTEYLALCLTTLCGRWGRAGDVVTRPNAMLPPWQPRAQPFPPFPAWGFGEPMRMRGLTCSVAGMPTGALAEEILQEGEGQVKALICLGGNPMTAWPDQRKTYRAMQALDLLVTLDPQMSETARLAHYVIAPMLTLETPGMSQPAETGKYYGLGMGIPGTYAQYSPRIVEPPPGADLLEEWQFFHGLARRLDLDLELVMGYGFGPYAESPPSTLRLGRNEETDTETLYRRMAANARIPFDEVLRYPHGHVWDADVRIAPRDPDCTARLSLADTTMMAELQAFYHQYAQGGDTGDYPYRLVPRRSNQFMNSSGRNIARLHGGKTYNPAYMHPEDLTRLGLQDGDQVIIRSAYDYIDAIVEADATLRCGVIAMSHGFGDLPQDDGQTDSESGARLREVGSNTGRLLNTEVDFDPYSGMPRIGNVPVSVTVS